ncbi:hypothetical protein CKM354_000640900 [Cercospora kikuchii]|uniref:Uncharacterized protein n=1 Tax=Cercospora kikuchii TaxID=84275 RepID=A0A9P3FDA4_9PEZI|nr:uncharacterized protein CKM354_000640900 [Cercospora kikuchii]GIZ43171.1 hypothetical protein CKM354_000640900 [Cercospora kikuchii]
MKLTFEAKAGTPYRSIMEWYAVLGLVISIGDFALNIVVNRDKIKKDADATAQWIVRIVQIPKAIVSKESRAVAEQLASKLTARSTRQAAEQDLQVAVSALQRQTGHVAIEMSEEEFHDALEGDEGWWYAAEVLGLIPAKAKYN